MRGLDAHRFSRRRGGCAFTTKIGECGGRRSASATRGVIGLGDETGKRTRGGAAERSCRRISSVKLVSPRWAFIELAASDEGAAPVFAADVTLVGEFLERLPDE